MPVRFNEWGRTILQLQVEHLLRSTGNEYFYTGYYGQHEASECSGLHSDIAGSLMKAARAAVES